MLLECDRCEQCSLETMRCARTNDSAKSAHRVAGRFSIVWEIVQPSLNCERSAEIVYDSPLGRGERKGWWDDLRTVEHPTNMQPYFFPFPLPALAGTPAGGPPAPRPVDAPRSLPGLAGRPAVAGRLP